MATALPDVSVGRLTANSLAEAKSLVDKIVNYDETLRTADWQRRALFVADNADRCRAIFRRCLMKSSPTTCPLI